VALKLLVRVKRRWSHESLLKVGKENKKKGNWGESTTRGFFRSVGLFRFFKKRRGFLERGWKKANARGKSLLKNLKQRQETAEGGGGIRFNSRGGRKTLN